jgi:NAD(P)-dependent dehydrogenase (short-subunit alcohol dehydrogenase family)
VERTLEGKVAVVTGGSRGIGLGIAQSFVDTGAAVMLVSRKADGLEAAAAELERTAPGSDVAWYSGHVGRPEDAEACMQATLDRFGAVDILVNNAATNPYAGPTIGVDAARLDKTYEVNLRGPLLWSQVAWDRHMRDHGGVIINIAAGGAYATSSQLGVYCMFKAALGHPTKQLGAELGPGVRVNCIAPGLIKTDFAKALWDNPETLKASTARSPLLRIGVPDEIAGAAVLMGSKAGDFMTGQTIVIDGGATIS